MSMKNPINGSEFRAADGPEFESCIAMNQETRVLYLELER